MTNGAFFRHGASRAAQHGPEAVERDRNLRRGRQGAGRGVWYVNASSLPLPARSSGPSGAGADTAAQGPRAIALKLRALKDLEQVVVIPTSYKAFGLHAAFEGLVFLE